MECFQVGAGERTKPLGPGRVEGAEHTKLRRRGRRVDALHTGLRLFARRRQERVHVLAEVARHEPDVDASNDRVDAQCPRIVRIRRLSFEGERIARTEATNLLLSRRSSVAQPVNEESGPVAALGIPLWNREDLEHVGLALSATSGEHDERVGFPALEIEPFDEFVVVGATLRRQSIPEHRKELRRDVDLVEVREAAQRTEPGTFSRSCPLRVGEHVVRSFARQTAHGPPPVVRLPPAEVQLVHGALRIRP
jgi:hypothetical protein